MVLLQNKQKFGYMYNKFTSTSIVVGEEVIFEPFG